MSITPIASICADAVKRRQGDHSESADLAADPGSNSGPGASIRGRGSHRNNSAAASVSSCRSGSFFEDDLRVGRDGIPGHDAGNVEVLVEQFFSDATTATRFVLLGGEGGPAGQGRNGQAEADLEFNSANWKKLMSRAGNRICSTDGPTATSSCKGSGSMRTVTIR